MANALHIQVTQQLERGLSYAESCFETFRVIDGVIFQWDKHWQRLQCGLASFGLSLPETQQENIKQSCLDAAQQQGDDCLLRLTATGGDADWGLIQQGTPHIYIQTSPFSPSETNIHLQSVEYPFALLDKPAKFASDYALTLRAQQLWSLTEGNTALICKDGFVLSGLTANIALYVNQQWVTPNGLGILTGTVRTFLIQENLLKAQPCPTSILNNIEAAVLLNSGSFLQTIHHINEQTLDSNHSAIHALKLYLEAQQGVRL